MVFPTEPDRKRKASCLDMTGFIDIRALKKCKNMEPMWSMHYLKNRNQVLSSNVVTHLKTDLSVTKGAVYELMEGVATSIAAPAST